MTAALIASTSHFKENQNTEVMFNLREDGYLPCGHKE